MLSCMQTQMHEKQQSSKGASVEYRLHKLHFVSNVDFTYLLYNYIHSKN